MTRLHQFLFAFTVLCLSPAATAQDGVAPPVPPVPVAPAAVLNMAPGSLWTEVGARTLVGMNGNARRVGDLITIFIDEKSSVLMLFSFSRNGTTESPAVKLPIRPSWGMKLLVSAMAM